MIEHCVDDAIETDGAGSNCRIYFNRFNDFLTGVSVAPAAPGPVYIFRNILSGWRKSEEFDGYPFKFNVSSGIPIQWVYLYHNTSHTIVPGQNGFWFKQYSGWNHIISRNNIYSGTAYALENDSGSINTEDLDYDCVFTTKPTPGVIRWNGTTYNSLANFSSGTGLEIHGVTNQPSFINATSLDYYLPSNSTLIDKGIPIPGVNDGWLGAAPDLGALEQGMIANKIVANPSGVTIDWQAGAFGKYQLEFATNLAQPTWISLGGSIQAPSAFFQLTDSMTNDLARFYRLRHVGP